MPIKKTLVITSVTTGILLLSFAAIQSANQDKARERLIRDAPYQQIAEQQVTISSGKTALKQAQDASEAANVKAAAVCKWATTVATQSRIPKVSVPAECKQ